MLWAGNAILGKVATAYIGPFSLAFFRWSLAGTILVVWGWKKLWLHRAVIGRDIFKLVVLGILGVGLFNTILYLSLNHTTAMNAGIIQTMIPVAIIVVGALFGLEKTNAYQLTGLVLAVGGVVWVIVEGSWQRMITLEFNPGDLLVLLAALVWTVYSVLLKKWKSPDIPAIPFLTVQILVGIVVCLPFYLWEVANQSEPLVWHKETLMILAYVAIGPSMLAFYSWGRGVALGGANLAGMFIPLISVFTTLMAVLFLGEAFKLHHFIGISMALLGVAIASTHQLRTTS